LKQSNGKHDTRELIRLIARQSGGYPIADMGVTRTPADDLPPPTIEVQPPASRADKFCRPLPIGDGFAMISETPYIQSTLEKNDA
jgi:hypothetical protein